MKNFRTFELALQFYHLCTPLKLTGELRDQLQRASLSIALNLAEGRGKAGRKDQVRFFQISLGSVRECQALLMIAGLQDTEAWTALDRVAASLHRLIQRAT